MATIEMEGTSFSFSVLPMKLFSKGDFARTKIFLKNEFIDYEAEEVLVRDELEEWIFSMFRLLAGAYGKEHSLSFEKAGLAIDLYQHTDGGQEVSREERRKNDCVMAIRFLMRSKHKKRLMGGVYSLLLHREEIKRFATELRLEFDQVFAKVKEGKGEYLFVGVSPLGYEGCNYWYLDKTKSVKAGDFVWVVMGRHKRKQIVYVDSIRYFNENNAPFDPERVKLVLGKATDEELKEVNE